MIDEICVGLLPLSRRFLRAAVCAGFGVGALWGSLRGSVGICGGLLRVRGDLRRRSVLRVTRRIAFFYRRSFSASRARITCAARARATREPIMRLHTVAPILSTVAASPSKMSNAMGIFLPQHGEGEGVNSLQ